MNDLVSDIERELPRLRRFAHALTRDRELADDLVQDCIERALARRVTKRAGTSTRAWLYTILRNLHIDHIRRNRNRGIDIELSDDMFGEHETALDRVYVNEVLAALNTLTFDHREVLILAAVEGLSYTEIAAVVDVPLGTVMSRLSRARDALTATLEGPRGRHHLTRIK